MKQKINPWYYVMVVFFVTALLMLLVFNPGKREPVKFTYSTAHIETVHVKTSGSLFVGMEYNVDGIAELNMSPDDTISVALLDRFIINDIHTEMSKILEQCDYGDGEYLMPSDLYVMDQLRKKIGYLHVDHLTLHMLYVADTCEIKKY